MKLTKELVRKIRGRLTQNESGFTLPELLMTVVISSIIVGALASGFLVSTHAATASKQRLDRSHDAQQASTYFLSDAQNADYFSATTVKAPAMGSCPDFGASNVAVFEWTDAGIRKNALYGTTGSPAALVRRYCEAGVKQNDVSLVKNVGSPAPVVTCPTTPCSTTPAYLELTVNETTTTYEASAYTYEVRADPRPTPAGSPMSGIAIYVGTGGLTGGGSKTEIQATGGSVTVGGTSNCNGENGNTTGTPNQTVEAPEGFYGMGGGSCNGLAGGTLPADPLLGLATPTEPADSTTVPDKKNGYKPPNAMDCGSSMPTFQPGRYPKDDELKGGCLASGTYFFKAGAVLNNLVSASGGVHIYIQSGDGDLSNLTLSPLTSGPQAGVTIFTARSTAPCAASGTCQQLKTNDGVTINGVLYEPASELIVQSNSGSLRAGAINVAKLSFGGNSDGLIILGT